MANKHYRFINNWKNYNFSMPRNATKNILCERSTMFNQVGKRLATIIQKVTHSILNKKPFSDFLGFPENGQCFFYAKTKNEKEESLKVPYIKKDLGEKDKRTGYYDYMDFYCVGSVLMSDCYIGKYKGVGTESSLYYYVLVLGADMEDDIWNPAVAVEVITPIDKGEDFFVNEVKKAVSKFDPMKFTGKKIYINKCPKEVTGSAEMKPYSYKGQVITASSKQEAIQKIIAKTGDFKVGEKVTVSLETLYKETKKHKTTFGYTIDTSEKGYYDLKDKFGNTVCMDGETCEVKTISGLGDLILINRDGEKETTFTLSKKEAGICIF